MIHRLLAASFIICFIIIAHADELETFRIDLEAKKKVHISKTLELTHEQSEPFWDIYANYERDSDKLTKEAFNLIRKYSEGYKNNSISEQSATNMLAAFFRIEARQLQLKQDYLPKFTEILPTKKVFRFYQINNKIDSLISCDIAKKIPLIEPDMEL